jgi:hypothetical protein
MKFIFKILYFFASKNWSKLFSKSITYPLVSIILDEETEVYGSVKDDLGTITRVPHSITGYHYLDIVNVEGPVGEQPLKDEFIPIFKATGMYRSSGIDTFEFEIQLSQGKDFFKLHNEFKDHKWKVELDEWSPEITENKWITGRCATDSKQTAANILNNFTSKDSKRKYRFLQ